eukprot:5618106-Prymnesium_polylepis.2
MAQPRIQSAFLAHATAGRRFAYGIDHRCVDGDAGRDDQRVHLLRRRGAPTAPSPVMSIWMFIISTSRPAAARRQGRRRGRAGRRPTARTTSLRR